MSWFVLWKVTWESRDTSPHWEQYSTFKEVLKDHSRLCLILIVHLEMIDLPNKDFSVYPKKRWKLSDNHMGSSRSCCVSPKIYDINLWI